MNTTTLVAAAFVLLLIVFTAIYIVTNIYEDKNDSDNSKKDN